MKQKLDQKLRINHLQLLARKKECCLLQIDHSFAHASRLHCSWDAQTSCQIGSYHRAVPTFECSPPWSSSTCAPVSLRPKAWYRICVSWSGEAFLCISGGRRHLTWHWCWPGLGVKRLPGRHQLSMESFHLELKWLVDAFKCCSHGQSSRTTLTQPLMCARQSVSSTGRSSWISWHRGLYWHQLAWTATCCGHRKAYREESHSHTCASSL